MATAPVRRLSEPEHDMTFGAGMRNIATGSEAAGQRVRTRLLVVLGEEQLDTSAGVPWWQDPSTGVRPIMGVPRDLRYAESVIKRTIIETDGIATIDGFDSSFNAETRKWSVTADGHDVDGEPWEINEVTF